MAASVISSFVGTEAFNRLLLQPKETLAQRVLVQADMIRDFCTAHIDNTQRPEQYDFDDQLSYNQARILELEELLADAKETISRLVEGDATEWDDK